MKVRSVRVRNFKSIEDSGEVELNRVTCLVGKNESGKTAFLEALWAASPAPGQDRAYDPQFDYPKRSYIKYKKNPQTAPSDVVSLRLQLEPDEIKAMEERFGDGILSSDQINVVFGYGDKAEWTVPLNEAVFISWLLDEYELPAPTKTALAKAQTWREFRSRLSESESEDDGVVKLRERANKLGSEPKKGVVATLRRHLPRFFYFDDYSLMPGTIDLDGLKAKMESDDEMDKATRTFLAFLDVAGTSVEELLDEDEYERIKAELEAASINITDQVFEYWSQNPELHVELDRENRTITNPDGSQVVRHMFHVRVRNDRHRVTLPFDNRSKGFVWFFSFLCYFSRIEDDSSVVLLLDEPGLNLHGKAQSDFLRMIEDLLRPNHQVVYTTHSPFMVDVNQLDAVRTVEDTVEDGTIVTSEVLRTSDETVFPLQAALGYDIAQSLFVGENCLIVEGPSDLLYLQCLRDHLQALGRESLSGEWVITPVGGADKIPTFVSLLGSNNLNIVVLTDVDPQFKQRLQNIRATGLLERSRILAPADLTKASEADLEDLFDVEWYLALTNKAYAELLPQPISEADLGHHPRITKRIADYFDEHGLGAFNHTRVAREFNRSLDEYGETLPASTIDRFEEFFQRINKHTRA